MTTQRLRTMTLTLRGAHQAFKRNLSFAADMHIAELIDRTCIALGRSPTPDAVLQVDGTYIGRGAYHFNHPELRPELMQEPLPAEPGRMQLILDRLGGWVFDITVDDRSAWYPEPIRMELSDTVPLLPGPQIRLPEFNAVAMIEAGDPLPPDLERTIIVEALLEHMAPEVPDPATAMELYTVLSEAGRPFALPEIEPLVRTIPDVEVIFELLRLATGQNPPHLTKPGFLPVKYTRQLVEKFPALHPVPRNPHHGYFRYSYSSRDAELLTSIIELGRRIGVLTAGPGEQLTATDFGREVLAGEERVLARLKAEILRARISEVPYPPVASPESPRLTFAQFLASQEPPVRYERRCEDGYPEVHYLSDEVPRDGWREPLPF